MVKFACFSTSPANRSKAAYQSATQDQSIKLVKGSVKSLIPDNNNSPCNSVKRSTSPYSLRDCWRSDGLNVNLPEDNQETEQIKKSHSLGSILEKESGYSGDDIAEDDDIDREFPFDLLNGWNLKEISDSSDKDNANTSEIFHHENDRKDYRSRKENDLIKPIDVPKYLMHHESLLSIEVLKQDFRDWRADTAEQAVDDFADFGCSSEHIPTLSKSFSASNLRVKMNGSSKHGSGHGHIFCRSRSFSDLQNLNTLEMELQNGEKYCDSRGTVKKNIVSRSNLPLHHDVRRVPRYDGTEEGGLGLVRRKIVNFRVSDGKCLSLKLDMDNKADNWDQLTPQEFSMRRVENWISQIDIHGDLIVEEQGETSTTASKEEPQTLAGVDLPKPDARSNLAMEVAYNYISSLTSSSSSAQMANLGLVSIPVLGPFVSLRVLNLSGNALVHITPGCFPKGLHMLNLSKNNISTIEGLRDLSRLRVLDLNHNQIARIGHGLSSCSSLKELHLAGNKISEVEGLHRLLQLNALDLRFNKISTSKGLAQLAANYASLQAINLEGNPAQKNVGDEQLIKFLLGLLPDLVYYNKQAIRMGSTEVSGRAQYDGGFRVERKLSQRGSHGSDLNQQQAPAIAPSRKTAKDKRVRLQLPSASFKVAKLRSDASKKPNEAVKRSRSTDALRVFSKCNYKRK